MAIDPNTGEYVPDSDMAGFPLPPSASPVASVEPLGLPQSVPAPVVSPSQVDASLPASPAPAPALQPSPVVSSPVVSPGTTPAPGGSTSGSVSVSGSASKGGSFGGITREGIASEAEAHKAIGTNPYVFDLLKQSEKNTADAESALGKSYADQKNALESQGRIAADAAESEAKSYAELERHERNFIDLQEKANLAIKAQNEEFVSGYKGQLAAIRQLTLQDPNPTHNMSIGAAFGMTGAAFAQGFLAAKGVHIDPMGAIDRWVDRTIQEHRMKIADAKDDLQGYVHLYEIARQNSKDADEARLRMKGYVTEAVKTSMLQHAAMFKSDLAKQDAALAAAKLDEAGARTTAELRDRDIKERQSVWFQSEQNRIAREQLAVQRQSAYEARAARLAEAKARREDAEAKRRAELAALRPTPLADPTNVKSVLVDGQGRVVPPDVAAKFAPRVVNNGGFPKYETPALPEGYRFEKRAAQPYMVPGELRPDRQKAAIDFYNETSKPYVELVAAAENLRELYIKNKQYVDDKGLAEKAAGAAGVKVFLKKNENEFNAARDRFVESLVKETSGTRASDQEFDRKLAAFKGSGLNSGESSFAANLDGVLGTATKALNMKLTANPDIVAAPDNEGKTVSVYNPDETAINRARREGVDAGADPVSVSINDKASARGNTQDITSAYDSYIKSAGGPTPSHMPEAAKAVDTAGKILAAHGVNSPGGAEAFAALQQMASGRIGNHELDDHTVGYARSVLSVFAGNNGKPSPELEKLFTDHRTGAYDLETMFPATSTGVTIDLVDGY